MAEPSAPTGVTVAPAPDRWDIETDVAIIGAGAAGLTAGLRAVEAGAETLVLERDDRPSGSTAMSSGFIPAPGTRFQAALGTHDSPDQFASDIQKKASGQAQPETVATVTRSIGPAIEWLADAHGFDWVVLDDFLYPGHSAHRMHAVPEKTGAALMARLQNAAETAGLPIATGARVTTLHCTADGIAGLTLIRPDGTRETVGCNALILACNGYGGNADLLTRHIPEISGAVYHGHPGNTGDAVMWGQQLGARIDHLSGYQGHGSLAHPHGILITWALMMEGGIQVNANGQRFSNEHGGYSEQAVNVLAQPGGIAWNIYDARLHELGLTFPDYCTAVDGGAVRSGDMADLTSALDLPPGSLARTLSDLVALDGSDEWGRDFTNWSGFGPDLFAVRVTGALFHTQGGLVVDGLGRVTRDGAAPFANFFAVGGAACGVSGPDVEGYLSGNGLLTAIGLGYVAGRQAAMVALG